jgi:hypothetical protein
MNNLYKSGVLLCMFWLGFVPGLALLGQNSLDLTVSFQARNESVRSVLARLSDYETLNLTYNATDTAFDELVSYTANQKTVYAILNDILSLIDHEYKQMGNHLLIVKSTNYTPFRKPPNQSATNTETKLTSDRRKDLKTESRILNAPADTIIQQVDVPVYVRDTLVVFDTVVRFEVQTIRDTVFIEKAAQPSARGSRSLLGSNISNGVFRFEADRQSGLAVGIYLAPAVAGYHYLEMLDVLPSLKTEGVSARNIGLGFDLLYNNSLWQLSLGASLNSYATRFDYIEVNSFGGFFQIDTLDVFYTIINEQQVFTYITDSTWIPLNRDELIYDRLNRMGLLNINLGVAYSLYRGSNFDFYIKTGMHMALPVWLKGSTIVDSNGFMATELNKGQFNNWLFGYSGVIGIRYQLGNWIDVYAEPGYQRYLTPTTKNHPLKRRLHDFGLKVGIMYYF